MRARWIATLAGLVSAVAVPAALAAAPIMPLSEVQSGMHCTGYSVFKGQEIESFDVDIVDVVGQASNGAQAPRILVRVSGPKVDATGVGPGFSGSPIMCPRSDGTLANAGAISETVGDYGGKTVLATPIEQILATPVQGTRPPPARRRGLSPRDASILARARPLATPITVSGLDASLMSRLSERARKRGIAVLAAPPVPADSAPVLPFEPGSAVAVGLSSGDISVSGIGTVAYVDGDNVWAYGHSFDGLGARQLLLQDAYVAAIINNPLQVEDIATYKLSGPVHDRGTISSDGFNAVAGTVGALPPLARVHVVASDEDRGTADELKVNVADETDVGNPAGISALQYVGPLAVSEAATEALGAAPQQLAGRMCFRVTLRERRKPLRFCNRYVADGVTSGELVGANPVALSAGTDASGALSLLDLFKARPIHVTRAWARVHQTRAQRQAYLRSVVLPRRAHRGETVPARIVTRVVRGPRKVFSFEWRIPHKFKPGEHKVRLRGADPDSGFGFFDEIIIDLGGGDSFFDSEGPRTIHKLRQAFAAVHRWDGIRLKSGARVYRDPTYRIGGRASTTIRILKQR
jgi:hypothetical protein